MNDSIWWWRWWWWCWWSVVVVRLQCVFGVQSIRMMCNYASVHNYTPKTFVIEVHHIKMSERNERRRDLWWWWWWCSSSIEVAIEIIVRISAMAIDRSWNGSHQQTEPFLGHCGATRRSAHTAPSAAQSDRLKVPPLRWGATCFI